MKNVRIMLQNFFLEYWNDYIMVERMAEHYNISEEHCKKLIEMGKEIHEEDCLKK